MEDAVQEMERSGRTMQVILGDQQTTQKFCFNRLLVWTGDAGSNQLEARTPELAWFAVSSYWSQSNREASEDNGPKSGIRVSAFGPRSTTRTAQNALSYTWFSVFRRSGVAARQGTRFSKKGDIESPQKEGGFLIWQVWIAALLGFIN